MCGSIAGLLPSVDGTDSQQGGCESIKPTPASTLASAQYDSHTRVTACREKLEHKNLGGKNNFSLSGSVFSNP